MPERIQLRRTKGWRLPPNTVIVSRPSKWGNPFVVGVSYPVFEEWGPQDKPICHTGPLTPQRAVEAFRDEGERLGCFEGIEELRGKNLACWCKPDVPCHADVLLELANAPAPAEKPLRAAGEADRE